MTTQWRVLAAGLFLVAGGLAQSGAVELKVSREALTRTLNQQLFNGPDGRYYLKGNAHSACFIFAEDPTLSFVEDRIVVRVKTHARLGRAVAGACLGIPLSLPAEVSLAPDAEGETIGFRDARVDRVSEQRELNFVLSPFLSHEGERRRPAAQGPGRVGCVHWLQGEPGSAEDSFHADPGRCAGFGCGRGFEREVKPRPEARLVPATRSLTHTMR